MKIGKTFWVAALFVIFSSFNMLVFGQAPSIVQQPVDQGTIVGQTATFTVVATGADTLHYQWKKDGVNIALSDTPSYTVPPTVIGDNNSTYSCVVSNSQGSVETNTVKLYVSESGVRIQNSIQVLYDFNEGSGININDHSGVGTPLKLRISTPDAVSWTPYGLKINGSSIIRSLDPATKIISACKSSNEITIEAWVRPDENNVSGMRNIVTNSSGLSARNFAMGPVFGTTYEFRARTTATDNNGLPSVGFSSVGAVNTQLTHIVFTRDANGNWKCYINGVVDSSGTSSGDFSNWDDTFKLLLANEKDASLPWLGEYYLLSIYNRHLTDVEVNQNYSLGVNHETTPYIINQPSDQYAFAGDTVSFSVEAVGTNPMSYQWQKNGTDITGATSKTYTIFDIQQSDSGSYRCIISNSDGSTASNPAQLNVLLPDSRVTDGVVALYKFNEGSGESVSDVSGFGTPLDLTINSPSAVSWNLNGLKIVSEPTILSGTAATKIYNECTASNALTVEAWIAPADTSQSGPARILTVSQDGLYRNFSLLQNGSSYEFRTRTSGTDDNGVPALSSPAGMVSQGFQYVVYTYDNTNGGKLYINGQVVASMAANGDFSNWNNTYRLSLGNELIDSRPWLGLLNYIAIFPRSLSQQEITHNYELGPFGVVNSPSNLTLVSNNPGVVAFSWTDNSTNEDGFVVERSTNDPSNFVVLDTLTANTTNFVDSTVLSNTAYYYRVKAFNSINYSYYSDTLNVTTVIVPINAPTDLAGSLHPQFGVPVLTWVDNSDNEDGFVIEKRSTAVGSTFEVVDTVAQDSTSYMDVNVSDSTSYLYRVYAFNKDTVSQYSNEFLIDVLVGVENEGESLPTEFSLKQNYPNPFNPSTTIRFGLPEKADVTITVYNLLGQRLIELARNNFGAGWHTVNFDASQLTSGIYIYTINAVGNNGKKFVDSKKMILLK